MATEHKYGKITTEKGSIPDSEPVFLLRAQDALAVPTLLHYIDLRRQVERARSSYLGDEELNRGALFATLEAFIEWPRKKLPD